jgi:NAD(P)-dependent dehydrogenase (short-subunit alcohol dehydrogenase family)
MPYERLAAIIGPASSRPARRGHCRAIIERAVREFGRIDILVNNAPFQRTYASIEDISDEEWNYTFQTNIGAM